MSVSHYLFHWYATIEWPHILYTLLPGVLGLFLTWPLYRVLHAISNMEPVPRVIIGLVISLFDMQCDWCLMER